jgi:hypothetical protein
MRTKGLTETCSRIFAKPTMMLGENLAELQGDARSGSRGHDQDDAQECFLARDVLDSEWELVRLGGMKPGMGAQGHKIAQSPRSARLSM